MGVGAVKRLREKSTLGKVEQRSPMQMPVSTHLVT